MADEDVNNDLPPELPVDGEETAPEDIGEVPPDEEVPQDDEEVPPEPPRDDVASDEDEPESIADDPCRVEGANLQLCIQTEEAAGTGNGKDGTCDCYSQPVIETFPILVESNYAAVQAFTTLSGTDFCKATEESVCNFLYEEASCCCVPEASALTACIFVNRVINRYNDSFVGCTSSSCTFEIEEDNGPDFMEGNILYYVIGCALFFCLASTLFYCCCSPRAKARRANGKIEVNINHTSQNNTTENQKVSYEDQHLKKDGKKRKVKKRVSKKRAPKKARIPDSVGSSDSSDFQWDDFNESFYQIPKSKEKDDESKESPKKRKSKRRTSKVRRKSSKLIIDEEIEERRVSRRRRSKREESSDDDSDDRNRRKRRSKAELKERRREIEDWHKKEKRKRASRRKSKSSRDIEQSIRKARTVLDELDDTEQDGKVQVTVIHSLQEVIALLEEDKMKLEARQREVDEERMRLQMDIESSMGTISKIDEETEKNNHALLRANLNQEVIQVSAERANRQDSSLSSGLESMKLENKEIAILLERLKQAEMEMQQKLAASEGTRQSLRADKEKLVSDLAKAKISKVLEHKRLLQERLEVDSLDGMEHESAEDEFDIEMGLKDDHLNGLPLGLMPQPRRQEEDLRIRMVEVHKTDLDNVSTVTHSMMGDRGENETKSSIGFMSTLAEEHQSEGPTSSHYSGESSKADSYNVESNYYKGRDESSTRSMSDHYSDDSDSYDPDRILLRYHSNSSSSDDQSESNTYYGYG